MAELKPCPFCGDKFPTQNTTTRKGHLVNIQGRSLLTENDSYEISCRICGCRTGVWCALSSAIEAWNRRAEDGK